MCVEPLREPGITVSPERSSQARSFDATTDQEPGRA